MGRAGEEHGETWEDKEKNTGKHGKSVFCADGRRGKDMGKHG